MRVSCAIAILAVPFLAGGCASIFDGTSQEISVSTTPVDARCTFWRNGVPIADIASTPSAVRIKKTKYDLVIVCSKPGYAAATYLNRSGLAGATWANVMTIGLAWVVDSASGADNKYDSPINLALAALPPGAPASAPAAEPPVPSSTPPPPPPAQTVTPADVPMARQIECAATDGSRLRVTGAACPAGWTLAR
jgi:hypothetical protein